MTMQRDANYTGGIMTDQFRTDLDEWGQWVRSIPALRAIRAWQALPWYVRLWEWVKLP